jgi:FAD/FMN-containing dehydrogenase
VPPEKVGDYLRDLRKLYHKYGYNPSLYGHLGQGCIHCRVDFDLYTAKGVENFRSFLEEATDLVVGYGGSFSDEHGDGQASGEFLPTRPSFYRTTTRAGCGRATPTRWAGFTGGRAWRPWRRMWPTSSARHPA